MVGIHLLVREKQFYARIFAWRKNVRIECVFAL